MPDTPQTQYERSLQAPGIFAAHCKVSVNEVEVGALIIDSEAFEEKNEQAVNLYSPDEEPRCYRVQLPRLYAFVNTRITLKRLAVGNADTDPITES